MTDIAKTDLTGLDAVIHLAGENLFGPWTAKKKEAIRRSRVISTCQLIERLRETWNPPKVFVSASGVAFYGDQKDAPLTEKNAGGEGFLAEICRAWEAAAQEAADFARVVSLRTPLVLGPDGGAAVILRRLFKCGLGGRLGSGKQWMSWIHAHDLARLYLFAVENAALSGPVNACAPTPVTNREFTEIIAKILRRPALFPAPEFLLKRLPGGMGEMVLQSQRALPAAAQAAGFTWFYPALPEAARDALTKRLY